MLHKLVHLLHQVVGELGQGGDVSHLVGDDVGPLPHIEKAV